MPPRFYSTRGAGEKVSFEDALLYGLAPDGGLYIPDAVPRLEPALWRYAESFADLGVEVLSRWVDESPKTLTPLVHDALNFPLPLVPLGNGSLGGGVWVLELFHGPTLSFKDVGARLMARLMQLFLERRGETRTILVATSGDTGSAVADGFAGMDSIDVVLLYPQGGVSDVQERQLVVRRDGVRALAVEGTFDDCQHLVKEAFVDPKLSSVPLSSANSINIGRLLPQSLYYLWVGREVGGYEDGIDFCVPSGNLGNLTAGVLAQRMGLGVHRFLAAHNANDFFPRYLDKLADAYAFGSTVATVSNAMDVGAPSNFERLYTLLGRETFEGLLWGVSVPDEVTKERIKRVYDETGYVACPHTAVGLEAVARYREETGDVRPVVSLATAHPAKFPEVVSETLNIAPPTVEALEALRGCETNVQSIAPDLAALREVLLSG